MSLNETFERPCLRGNVSWPVGNRHGNQLSSHMKPHIFHRIFLCLCCYPHLKFAQCRLAIHFGFGDKYLPHIPVTVKNHTFYLGQSDVVPPVAGLFFGCACIAFCRRQDVAAILSRTGGFQVISVISQEFSYLGNNRMGLTEAFLLLHSAQAWPKGDHLLSFRNVAAAKHPWSHHVLLAKLVNNQICKCNRFLKFWCEEVLEWTMMNMCSFMQCDGKPVRLYWQLLILETWDEKRRQQNSAEQSILTLEKTTVTACAEMLNGTAVQSLRYVLLET